ncbi:hypothetical protein V6N12_059186 [Hibiscus sabdariffa]|uniref:NAC domain-containing protein n=1 Tax=Hibiscus sabdariffa TaxID=183260 RepID=A0ABR2EUB3_9ROSI
MELLWEKQVLGRDSFVQVGGSLVPLITQFKDICKFEPGELPGRSELQSGDDISYFFCSPRYKYRYSRRKNRVTKKDLGFYKGRVRDKNKKETKTPWVMHEFELTLNLPNQDQLNSKEPVAFTENSGIQSELVTDGQTIDEFVNSLIKNDELYSNQPIFLHEKEDFNQIYNVNSTDIQKEVSGELINQKLKAPNGCVRAMNQVGSIEQDNSSWSSLLVANDPTKSNGVGNQQNTSIAEEGSSLAFESHVPVDSIPTAQILMSFSSLLNYYYLCQKHLKTQKRFIIVSLASMKQRLS